MKFTVTVLTFTARLTLVHAFAVDGFSYGLAVSNLRRADVRFDLEFSQKSVYDNVEVQLAHARDNGLTGFLVGISLERGVFFGELDKRHGHFILTRFRLRLDRKLNNGVGEGHLFKNYGVLFVAKRIARRGVFKSYDGADIARVNFGNFGTRVSVHLYETTYPLLLAFRRVITVRTRFEYARICSEISKSAHERVGCDFKRKSREGLVVGGLSDFFFLGVGVDTDNVRYVDGGRKIVDNRVKEHLNALILIRRTAENGRALHCDSRRAQTLADFFGGELHSFEELFHKLVVALRRSFHNLHVRLFGSLDHVRGDFRFVVLLAVLGVVNFGVHFDEVDDTFKGILLADGKLDGNGVGVEPVPHHFHGARKVCAVDIHFVNVRDAGHLVLVRLTPDGFGLGLDAALRAERRNRAVQNTEGTLDFYGKVNVSRSVDDINSALVLFGKTASRPVTCSRRGGNGYTSLLFLYHPVHSSRTVVGFAYLMVDAGIKQNTFGCGGLACVYMRHDAYISCMG